MVDFSFFTGERTFACGLLFLALYLYGPSPVPEVYPDTRGVLVNFSVPVAIAGSIAPFFFGLATAPAHVEDELDDDWLDFARAGKVSAFKNQERPELRNLFWKNPEVEINLAADTGVQVFRMGVDWGRIVPTLPPVNGTAAAADKAVLARYREIMQIVRKRNMKVMMTLFHHSAPKWAGAFGGWTKPQMVSLFRDFTEVVVAELGDLVDYWVPFNEPTVFVTLTYCAGAWPPGFPQPGPLQSLYCLMAPTGNYSVAMDHVALAHRAAYRAISARSSAPVGVAHNVAYMSPAGVNDIPFAWLSDRLVTYPFIDKIRSTIDFVGLNYYGQEFFAGAGQIAIVPEEEYSDSGRAVFPDGLFLLLKAFYKRYKLPIIVTENGVADSGDLLRPVYMLEHLLAVGAARAAGIPIAGYIFWTISDNWEWADGFCPKFGLAEVNRSDPNLSRVLRRTSYDLFSTVVATNEVTAEQRLGAWAALQAAASNGTQRHFCRALEGGTGMTGFSGLDEPVFRPFSLKDWRYGRYLPPPYQDSLCRMLISGREAAFSLAARIFGPEISADVRKSWAELKAKTRPGGWEPPATGARGEPKASWDSGLDGGAVGNSAAAAVGERPSVLGADGRGGKRRPVAAVAGPEEAALDEEL